MCVIAAFSQCLRKGSFERIIISILACVTALQFVATHILGKNTILTKNPTSKLFKKYIRINKAVSSQQ